MIYDCYEPLNVVNYVYKQAIPLRYKSKLLAKIALSAIPNEMDLNANEKMIKKIFKWLITEYKFLNSKPSK
jgi:hypothetical protein